MGDYTEFGNILNLAMVVKDDRDRYVVVAAWLESHDNLIRELLSSPDMTVTPRKRYSTTGRSGSVHFVCDDGGRIFLCITKEKYVYVYPYTYTYFIFKFVSCLHSHIASIYY